METKQIRDIKHLKEKYILYKVTQTVVIYIMVNRQRDDIQAHPQPIDPS